MSDARFLGPVPRQNVRRVLTLAVSYSLVFDVLYGGASLLAPHVPWRVHVNFPFEAHIPFVPEAAILYLSVLALLGLAPFVLRDLPSYTALLYALIAETVVGFACFVLLPVEPSQIPTSDSPLYRFADWLNLEGNYLPSLHVAFAVTAWLAYVGRAKLWGKTLLSAWTLGIVASTLLLHQHYVLDVITGALLAWACWRMAQSMAISGCGIRAGSSAR